MDDVLKGERRRVIFQIKEEIKNEVIMWAKKRKRYHKHNNKVAIETGSDAGWGINEGNRKCCEDLLEFLKQI